MLKRIFNLLLLLIVLPQTVLLAQTNDSITQSESGDLTVNYTSPPKTYYIADVKVTGVEETMYAGILFKIYSISISAYC
jgi:outer membrane protein insertion porin family